MRTLLIELPHTSTAADRLVRLAWVQANGQAESGGTHVLGDKLAQDLRRAGQQQAFALVAVLPESRISWHSVALPARLPADSKKRQALLQGLIEPAVLGETQDLHLALMPHATAGQAAWVMACGRQWLSECLSQLGQWGLMPTRLIPASCPAPPDTSLNGQVQDVTGQSWLLVAGTNAKAQSVFERWLLTSALLPMLAQRHGMALTSLWAQPAAAQSVQSMWPHLNIQIKEAHELWREVLRTPWDAAQFDLQLKGWRHWRTRAVQAVLSLWQDQAWRPLRVGVLACLGVQAIGMLLWLHLARTQLQTIELQQKQLLLQWAPQTTLVLDAPAQLEQVLVQEQRRQGQMQSDDFEPLMNVAHQVIPPGQIPTRIDYQEGQLKLAGLAHPDPGLLRRARDLGVELRVQQDVWTLRTVALARPGNPSGSSP